jgi:hypothetical protein
VQKLPLSLNKVKDSTYFRVNNLAQRLLKLLRAEIHRFEWRFNIMNKHSRVLVFRSLLVSFFCLSAFTSAFAFADNKQIQSVVLTNLQKKLKTDLANESVSVKLNNVEEYKISKNKIGLKGNGFCLITSENNELPMTFDVKVNPNNLNVIEVQYDFAELTNSLEYALLSNEEVLMKELMGKISQDYKTENVVIAIDGVEDVSSVTKQKEFTGIGEVRIGTLVWNKIKFDVVLDKTTNTATKINYKIEN